MKILVTGCNGQLGSELRLLEPGHPEHQFFNTDVAELDITREFIMSKQLFRSATSVGANIHEGLQAQSKPDFISKLSISLKEASEASYWLTLLHKTAYFDDDLYNSLKGDIDEIIRLLIASIKTSKKNLT